MRATRNRDEEMHFGNKMEIKIVRKQNFEYRAEIKSNYKASSTRKNKKVREEKLRERNLENESSFKSLRKRSGEKGSDANFQFFIVNNLFMKVKTMQ